MRTEIYSLEKRLEEVQENHNNLNTKCTKVMKKYETLRRDLLPKVNRLETENALLRQVAQEKEALSNENRLLLLQLRATEFYQFLMNTKDTDSEESLSQYIKSEEDLHCEKFLLLIKRQLVAAKKENHRFQLEIHEYEKRIAEFSKKEQKYKALVQDLRGEAKRCREQLDEAAKTPANPRLRSLLVDSIKRQHLGFDETRDNAAFEYDQQFLSTATKRPKISKLQIGGPRTFDDGEQIELEENQREEEERVNGESVSAAPPISFDDDAFELQPTTSHARFPLNVASGTEVNVPKKMLQRVAAGASKPSTSLVRTNSINSILSATSSSTFKMSGKSTTTTKTRSPPAKSSKTTSKAKKSEKISPTNVLTLTQFWNRPRPVKPPTSPVPVTDPNEVVTID
ncbi:hypothetical protein WR25_12496 [Diploscapter pachys]|uniref:Uncharacterized protein n=1 Tax=Diploscapter pachys TaxID=2018661 RepID=A0A2A2LX85_9BILA|nr:hypothetical protein WR25_12496 [Diploscapter pachys]